MICLIKFAVGVNPIAPPCPFVVKFRMGKNTKDKAAVVVRQLSSGEVLGEIITETGKVAISKSFGVLTEDEYKRILKLIELENPDIAWCEPIELTGN